MLFTQTVFGPLSFKLVSDTLPDGRPVVMLRICAGAQGERVVAEVMAFDEDGDLLVGQLLELAEAARQIADRRR